MAISIGRAFQKFGQKVSKGAQKFGQKVVRGAEKGLDFAKKALPEIEKISGKVGGIIQKATPFVAAVVPELAPLVYGAGKLASKIGKGSRTGQTLIKQGESTVGALKRGDDKSAIQSGLAFRRTAGI